MAKDKTKNQKTQSSSKNIPQWLQGVGAIVGALAALLVALAAFGFFKGDNQTHDSIPYQIHPIVEFKYRAVPFVGNLFINVRAQRSEDSERVATLPSDGLVRTGEEVDGWRPVKLSDGTEGWVHSEAVKIVD